MDVCLGDRAHHTRHQPYRPPSRVGLRLAAAAAVARPLPGRPCSHDRAQRPDRPQLPRLLRLSNARRFPPGIPAASALPHQRPTRDACPGCRTQTQGRDRRVEPSAVSSFHLARSYPAPGKRPRQRPLVSLPAPPSKRNSGAPASPARRWSSCRSGTPTPFLTMRSARFSTASASAVSASQSPTTTSAARPSSNAPTTPSPPTSAAPWPPANRLSSTSAPASTGSQQQGYEHFGILGTSLGSCYGFIAAAHDPRLKVCAFNHASTWFGDVVWTGQSTRHIRAAFEAAGLTQDLRCARSSAASAPWPTWSSFAASPKRVLVVHAKYDLTFLEEFSLDVLRSFDRHRIDYVSRVLPCGHYTTGETPYKYIDAWYSRQLHPQTPSRSSRQQL